MKNTEKILVGLGFLWISSFLIGLVLIPLVTLGKEYWIHAQHEHWKDPFIFKIAAFSIFQASVSTILAGIGGLGVGLWARFFVKQRFQNWLSSLFQVPYGIPALAAAITWVVILGQQGLQLGWLYSAKAVIFAHVFFNIPLIALSVLQGTQRISMHEKELIQTLGGNLRHVFQISVWPRIQWVLMSNMTQVFTICLMSFTLVLLLGGGPPVQTLETEIYSRIWFEGFDLKGALKCAFWQFFFTLIPWLGMLRFNPEKKEKQTSLLPPIQGKVSWGGLTVGLFFILPYFWVLRPDFLNIPWQEIFKPLCLSIQIAIGTALLATGSAVIAIGIFCFLQKWTIIQWIFSFLCILPNGTSLLVFGLGFWLAYERWLDPFEGKRSIIILIQAPAFFSFAFRFLWPLIQQSKKKLWEMAFSLGASPIKVFLNLEWLWWRGPLFSVFCAIIGATLGELGIISLFAHEDLVTLPVFIFRKMTHYQFEEAQALSALLLYLSLLGQFLPVILRKKREQFYVDEAIQARSRIE